ncbi:MAG: hypothetical protein H0Z24_08320 [Thermosipho sp. (in: Bacteria)]|nr:hypothetical protein [Thermosipho sp. (in: thermotogales)]
MGNSDIREKVGVKIYIKFTFNYPLLLPKNYLIILDNIFKSIGLVNYNFSGFLSRKKLKTKDGVYLKENAVLILKTFYSSELPKIIGKIISVDFFGVKPQAVYMRKIKYFREAYLVNGIFEENLSAEYFSEFVRKQLVKNYKELFNTYPKKDSLIVIIIEDNGLKKTYLYGSDELIMLSNVLGLYGESGFRNYLLEDKKYIGVLHDEVSS